VHVAGRGGGAVAGALPGGCLALSSTCSGPSTRLLGMPRPGQRPLTALTPRRSSTRLVARLSDTTIISVSRSRQVGASPRSRSCSTPLPPATVRRRERHALVEVELAALGGAQRQHQERQLDDARGRERASSPRAEALAADDERERVAALEAPEALRAPRRAPRRRCPRRRERPIPSGARSSRRAHAGGASGGRRPRRPRPERLERLASTRQPASPSGRSPPRRRACARRSASPCRGRRRRPAPTASRSPGASAGSDTSRPRRSAFSHKGPSTSVGTSSGAASPSPRTRPATHALIGWRAVERRAHQVGHAGVGDHVPARRPP
jgi:hypothetical protein